MKKNIKFSKSLRLGKSILSTNGNPFNMSRKACEAGKGAHSP